MKKKKYGVEISLELPEASTRKISQQELLVRAVIILAVVTLLLSAIVAYVVGGPWLIENALHVLSA